MSNSDKKNSTNDEFNLIIENANSNLQKLSLIMENTTEIDGRDGPEPTRYDDWENKGKCVDF